MRGLSLRERVTKIMMMAKCEGALRSLGPLSGGRSGAKGRGGKKGCALGIHSLSSAGDKPGPECFCRLCHPGAPAFLIKK